MSEVDHLELLKVITSSRKETTPDPALASAIRPKQKLKQMHWDKIDDIEKTFWTDIEHGKLSDRLMEKGILNEVEQVFVAKLSAMKRKKDIVSKTKAGDRPKKVLFLLRDLAQSFGINMHMFSNVEPMDLVLKVLHCDREILNSVSVLEFFTLEILTDISDQQRRLFMPYSTDYGNGSKGMRREPRQNPNELDRPDRLYLELPFNLSHYWKLRSRALLLTQTFQKDYQELLKKLQLIDDAVNNLRLSAALKNVLGIIRLVGNFMNDSSKQAMGFKLDTLQRLKFMKDDKNLSNFLHYIERIVRNEFPEYGLFVDDLALLQFVQNISVEQVDNDCKDFERIINNVLMLISKGNLLDPEALHPEDHILDVVVAPMERARLKNLILQTHWEHTLDEFKTLMEYFGENASDNNSRNLFFNKFVIFINDFKKAHGENIQKEEEQRVYEARKRAMEESISKKKRKTNELAEEQGDTKNTLTDSDEAVEDGEEDANTSRMLANSDVIDTLLEKLKLSAPRTTAAAKDRLARNRRSKAMSFYGGPAPAASPVGGDESLDLLAKLQALREGKDPKEYDSVNALKRRMSKRRDGPKEEPVVEEAAGGQTDQIYLRAQAMLNQLRT